MQVRTAKADRSHVDHDVAAGAMVGRQVTQSRIIGAVNEQGGCHQKQSSSYKRILFYTTVSVKRKFRGRGPKSLRTRHL
jgi:hypothetical protein